MASLRPKPKMTLAEICSRNPNDPRCPRPIAAPFTGSGGGGGGGFESRAGREVLGARTAPINVTEENDPTIIPPSTAEDKKEPESEAASESRTRTFTRPNGESTRMGGPRSNLMDIQTDTEASSSGVPPPAGTTFASRNTTVPDPPTRSVTPFRPLQNQTEADELADIRPIGPPTDSGTLASSDGTLPGVPTTIRSVESSTATTVVRPPRFGPLADDDSLGSATTVSAPFDRGAGSLLGVRVDDSTAASSTATTIERQHAWRPLRQPVPARASGVAEFRRRLGDAEGGLPSRFAPRVERMADFRGRLAEIENGLPDALQGSRLLQSSGGASLNVAQQTSATAGRYGAPVEQAPTFVQPVEEAAETGAAEGGLASLVEDVAEF